MQLFYDGLICRCGRRTAQGILNDGWNSLAHYYLNNFCDGTKQVGILHPFYDISYLHLGKELVD